MGNGASVGENRHSQLFQQGYKSLQEGRYTYAEIYYDQAIERHEGHSFWTRLDDLIEWERRDKAGQKGTDAKQKTAYRDGGQEEAAFPEVRKDSLKEENEVNVEMGERLAWVALGRLKFRWTAGWRTSWIILCCVPILRNRYMAEGRYEEATPH
ncbi:sodium stibogluconate resistance protein, partial [Trypanosoma cruzi]